MYSLNAKHSLEPNVSLGSKVTFLFWEEIQRSVPEDLLCITDKIEGDRHGRDSQSPTTWVG